MEYSSKSPLQLDNFQISKTFGSSHERIQDLLLVRAQRQDASISVYFPLGSWRFMVSFHLVQDCRPIGGQSVE